MPSATTFNWDQQGEAIIKLAQDAANEFRVLRPLFKPYGPQGTYTSTVQEHRISGPAVGALGPLTVDPNQSKSTIRIFRTFELQESQFQDMEAANTLTVEAAYRIAAAEEAIMLLGNGAAGFLTGLGVTTTPGELAAQTALLPAGAAGLAVSSVLDGIVAGIADLAAKTRYGRYAAIVSLDLYQSAFKPRRGTFDAMIYEINPLLIDKGFVHSQALPAKTGILLSLNGDGIKIATPVDTTVEVVPGGSTALLRVAEQFRLIVDVPDAVVALK